MKSFRSLADVEQAQLTPQIRNAVMRNMRNLQEACGDNYDPRDDGYLILVEPTTTDVHAKELFGQTWAEARLEGVVFDKESNCFLTCILFNNQFGLSIIVPDEPWLDSRFRAALLEEIGGTDGF